MLPAEAINRNKQRQAVKAVKALADKVEGNKRMRDAVKRAIEAMGPPEPKPKE